MQIKNRNTIFFNSVKRGEGETPTLCIDLNSKENELVYVGNRVKYHDPVYEGN